MARRNGISKSQGYANRVFCVEYDLKGMIDAYGINFIHWLADEISEGKINCKQTVERWSAHVALTQDNNFNPQTFIHNDDIVELEDMVA